MGKFYKPEVVASIISNIARKRGYRLVRISGGGPTLSRNHVLRVMDKMERENLYFVLETNGILLGCYKTYVRYLSKVFQPTR